MVPTVALTRVDTLVPTELRERPGPLVFLRRVPIVLLLEPILPLDVPKQVPIDLNKPTALPPRPINLFGMPPQLTRINALGPTSPRIAIDVATPAIKFTPPVLPVASYALVLTTLSTLRTFVLARPVHTPVVPLATSCTTVVSSLTLLVLLNVLF